MRTLAPKNLAPTSLAVLDQEGVLRDVKDDEGKCNKKIIRLRSQNLQDQGYTGCPEKVVFQKQNLRVFVVLNFF